MIVSPSIAQAFVDAVLSYVRVLYDVVSAPMLMYMLVLVDWIVEPML